MPAAKRREAILAAALDAFAEGGYHEIPLDSVAERAGISKALIYEHFPSKRDLHRALLESYVWLLLERVVSASNAAPPGEQRLRAGLDAYFAFVEERPDAWRMLVHNTSEQPVADWLDGLRRQVAETITERMAAEAPPGELVEGVSREVGIEMAAEQLVGAAQSLANWWVEHPETPRESVLAIAMDFMWLGLKGVEAGERWSG
jgi:AcrR family transcriptional regulator